MNFRRLQIRDIILCEPEIYSDSRGYFTELYRHDKLNKFLGYEIDFCQVNESKSNFGVLRGLHYQLPPFSQTKLVGVVCGKILDVVVDLRKFSKTFGQHLAVELSDKKKQHLLIPKGFAHGFIVLSKEAIVTYQSDCYYQPDFERGIAYDDRFLGINWRLKPTDIILSEKDKFLPLFNNSEHFELKDFHE